jgi:hypothetical protein
MAARHPLSTPGHDGLMYTGMAGRECVGSTQATFPALPAFTKLSRWRTGARP